MDDKSCSGRPAWRELTDHLSKIKEEQLAKELLTSYDIADEYAMGAYCIVSGWVFTITAQWSLCDENRTASIGF